MGRDRRFLVEDHVSNTSSPLSSPSRSAASSLSPLSSPLRSPSRSPSPKRSQLLSPNLRALNQNNRLPRRSSDPSSLSDSSSVFRSIRERVGGSPRRRHRMSDVGKAIPVKQQRVSNILSAWEVRGQHGLITDFYEFDSHLGNGAYGVVQRWKVKSNIMELEDTEVAVKIIPWGEVWGSCWRNREAEEVIRNELKTLIVLDNPFIIRFREWFESPTKGIYFVMEMCHGGSLQDLLDKICADEDKQQRLHQMPHLRRYFKHICYAVSYIHQLDPPVVHRDLKPENVLLKTDDGVDTCVKLIDFGLIGLQSGKTEEGAKFKVGTLPFMAPEMFFADSGKFTKAMDVWSLGVVLSWIVTSVHLGSQIHPVLNADVGCGFNVCFRDLFYAYKDAREGEGAPWNRELFCGESDAVAIGDMVFGSPDAPQTWHTDTNRATAAQILDAEWIRFGDPAAAACMELLKKRSFLYNIRSYQMLPAFDKKILSVMADHASEADVGVLRQAFRSLDKAQNGRLSLEDLINGFVENDVPVHREFMQELFDELDIHGTGYLEYNEWLAATASARMLRSDAAVNAAFMHLDTQGGGSLGLSDLVRAIGEEGADRTFQKVQQTRNGSDESDGKDKDSISYHEFKHLVRSASKRRASYTGDLPVFKMNRSRSVTIEGGLLESDAAFLRATSDSVGAEMDVTRSKLRLRSLPSGAMQRRFTLSEI